MSSENFKVGDIVYLSDGSPPLEITKIEGHSICVKFGPDSARIDSSRLTKEVTPLEGIKMENHRKTELMKKEGQK